MIDVIPKSNLESLDISRNVIEDETLIMLGDLYKQDVPIKLTCVNFSSCHITDVGLLYFMESISVAEKLKKLVLRDNFISESCEKLLLDVVEKNNFLTEFELAGNRLSMSCLSRIGAKLKKNVADHEMKEPNMLKNEVYRLNFERDKVKAAEASINKVMEEIARAVSDKEHALSELQRYKDAEAKRRQQLEDKIVAQQLVVEKKAQLLIGKREDINQQQRTHDTEFDVLVSKNEGMVAIMQI